MLLISHHRARIAKSPALTEAPVPDMLTLYALLSEPDALAKVVVREELEWLSLKEPLAARLAKPDILAVALRTSCWRLFRLYAGARSPRQVMRNCDCCRGPAGSSALVRARSLFAPYVECADGIAGDPTEFRAGSLVLARLPISGEISRRLRRPARRYGLYLLSCVVAAARWRNRAGFSEPPVLLGLLDDVSSWLSGNMAVFQPHLKMLGRAGIAVLAAGSRLPDGSDGEWLLDNSGTWWANNWSAQ